MFGHVKMRLSCQASKPSSSLQRGHDCTQSLPERVHLGMQEGQEFSTKKEHLGAHRMPKHCMRSALWAPACAPLLSKVGTRVGVEVGVGFRFKIEGGSVKISGKVQKKDSVSPVLACSQPNVVRYLFLKIKTAVSSVDLSVFLSLEGTVLW